MKKRAKCLSGCSTRQQAIFPLRGPGAPVIKKMAFAEQNMAPLIINLF